MNWQRRWRICICLAIGITTGCGSQPAAPPMPQVEKSFAKEVQPQGLDLGEANSARIFSGSMKKLENSRRFWGLQGS